VASEIETLVLENLMPDLDASFERAEKTKISLLKAFNTCNAEYKSDEDPLQDYPNESRSNHKVCRQNEQSLFYHNLTDPESYCVQLGQFLHNVPLLGMPDLSDRARSVKVVSDALNTNWCDSTLLQLDTSCTEQEDQLGTKESECSRKQQLFESTYCMWKYQLETACKELDTCHSKASTAYNNHVVEMQEFVEKWHGERTVMKQILCYCNVWLRDRDEFDNRSKYNASHFGVCKDLTVSPGQVNYGTPAGKVTCLLTDNHPGTSGFITQEYSGFMDFVADVGPCVEATTTEAPTTEAPTTEAPTPAPTTRLTVSEGNNRNPLYKFDDWNVEPSWDNGVPTGPMNAVVNSGLKVCVGGRHDPGQKKEKDGGSDIPVFSGTLTLKAGAYLRLERSISAVSGASEIIMEEGSAIMSDYWGAIDYPTIKLKGNVEFEYSSTGSHGKTTNFENFQAILGNYNLTVTGSNMHMFNFEAASTFSGLILKATDRYEVRAKAQSSLGSGDVTILSRKGDKRSAQLYLDVPGTIDDQATLTLNGGGYDPATQDRVEIATGVKETIGALIIDNVQQQAGSYNKDNAGWLSGDGELIVQYGGKAL